MIATEAGRGIGLGRRAVGVAATTAVLCLAALLWSSSARAVGGSVQAWGNNESGQLGNSTVKVDGCKCVPTPAPVKGLSGVTQVDAGYRQSVALLADGSVQAWGENEDGELGDGTTNPRYDPGPVSGITNAIAVGSGGEDGLALLSNGTVVTWGRNAQGELGIGNHSGPETCPGLSLPCSKKPVQVPGLHNVVAIAGGYYYSLALLADGTVMAWGSDYNGQLGDGGTQSGCLCVDHPIPVPGVTNATSISAGWYLAMAQLGDGTVRAWGRNEYGGVGNGTFSQTSPCYCSTAAAVTGLSNPTSISAGGFHGLAQLPGGGAVGWGATGFGALGIGTKTGPEKCGPSSCVKTPIPVLAPSGALELVGGGEFSLALEQGGTVSGWGINDYGEVGDGGTELRVSPVPVTGLAGVSDLSAGEQVALAIVGPSQFLHLSFAGSGTGTVAGQAISCTSNCDLRRPQGRVEILRALPSSSGGFAGFSGACAGTGPCQVKLDSDQSVTATFGVPRGTKIDRVQIARKKKTASFNFSALGAITGYECLLVRPKKRGKKAKASRKVKKPKKPKAPAFGACASGQTYKKLLPGKYTFEVRAVDSLGPDPQPATYAFRLKAQKKKKRHPRHRS